MRGLGNAAGALVIALICLSVGIAFFAWSASSGSAQTPVDIAIDMDTAGNDARLTRGADIQNCGEITATGFFGFDVILPPPGVDGANGIKAWEFDLNYDADVGGSYVQYQVSQR